jgi:hypothetical protein
MSAPTAELSPFLTSYVSGMHGAAIALALIVPVIRLLCKKVVGHGYNVQEAFHDGVSAAALPSLLAMVFVLISPVIIGQINVFEFFAAGLLGIFQTVSQLFVLAPHGIEKKHF